MVERTRTMNACDIRLTCDMLIKLKCCIVCHNIVYITVEGTSVKSVYFKQRSYPVVHGWSLTLEVKLQPRVNITLSVSAKHEYCTQAR